MQIKLKQKIAILGFGKEGQSAYRFLKKTKEFRGAEIWILDASEKIETPKGVSFQLGNDYLKDLKRFNIIIRSPGIKYYAPEIQSAIKCGSRVTSVIKLFFEFAQRRTKNIIGVTGTKGKGTTSTLITKILKKSGKKVFLAGNIGSPALDFISKLTKDSWIVLELSSFQLIDLTESPHISVALMVTSEHLNWHKNVREYRDAKANIFRFQNGKDFAVLANDYPASATYASTTKGKVFMFSRRTPIKKGTFVQDDFFVFSDGKQKKKICEVSTLQIPGEHNWENIGAAITVAKILHIPNAVIKKTIAGFVGLEHRLEFVAEKNGVRYYNDSYATTPETSIAAIEAFKQPKILILGGSHKGSDFAKLGKMISQSKSIKAIIGIGVEWERIKSHVHNPKIKIIEGCNDMNEIIDYAKTVAASGDVVLLSPACASFGMFQNYGSRGKLFKDAVKRLK